LAAVVLVLATGVPGLAQAPDVLTRARQAYNAQQFDEAMTLATEARGVDRLSHSAAVVYARAALERFRRTGDVADIATARQALLSADPARLTAGEVAELRLGTAELLFVDEQYGAAAELFAAHLDATDPSQRDRVFDWWASALDLHAQLAPDDERRRRYARLLAGAERELTRTPGSVSATYWLAAAARGMDDLDRAWSAAVAGWIQAPLVANGIPLVSLRHDLDRLMREAIVPERARRGAPSSDVAALAVAYAAEWDAIKARWRR